MPQLNIEYTANLGMAIDANTLKKFHQVLMSTGEFGEIDIKSQARQITTYAVGTAAIPRAYISAKLAILSGRSTETKQMLSGALLMAIQDWLQPKPDDNVQITVEILDMDRASYAKTIYGA